MSLGLPRYGLFAGALAFAGLPLYLHAPKFFVDEYGLSLTAVGFILLALRGLDFLQDPFIGIGLDKLKSGRGILAAIAATVMAGAMILLFVFDAGGNPRLWFAISMIFVLEGMTV